MPRKVSNILNLFLTGLLFLVCPPAGAASPPGVALTLEEVARGLEDPLYLTSPPGDPRLFIVEQPGRIRIIEKGKLLPTPFIDITDRVRNGGERGLLSVAFHPAYKSNRFFYINYTDRNGDTHIERYSVSSNPNVADTKSAKLILFVKQPYPNHNGGHIQFGPDGMLYIAMGDGGSGGDPHGNGQNLKTLLGKLLRIDVDHGDPYSAPADNPFVKQRDARGEIWAYGLRNPWRFAFDPGSKLLYIADVGQDRLEEIDVTVFAQKGLNYGWNTMEGSSCFSSSFFTKSCNRNGLVLPALEYDHSQGCTVIGGYVYRGRAIPEIVGQYFYSDYCSGFLRSFKSTQGTVSERHTWDVGELGSVLSFGEDAAGELYVLSESGVYRILKGSRH